MIRDTRRSILALATILLSLSSSPAARAAHDSSSACPGLPSPFDFSYPDRLCGNLKEVAVRLNDHMRALSRATGPIAAATTKPAAADAPASLASPSAASPSAAAPFPSPSTSSSASSPSDASLPASFLDPLPSSPRFLAYDSGIGGYGDTITGLITTFITALLDGRGFVVKHPWLLHAFEPASFDWRPTPDVKIDPVQFINNETQPVEAGRVPRIALTAMKVDPEVLFGRLERYPVVRVAWNVGHLTYFFKNNGTWGGRFRALGLRPPYSFGCILRLLIRPKPEVWQLMRETARALHSEHSLSVGVHIRVDDHVVWGGLHGYGAPITLNDTQIAQLMEQARPALECAQVVENWWHPSSIKSRWLVVTNSHQLKGAIQKRYADKVVVTNFVPRHVSKNEDPNDKSGEASEAMVQETVAEWLLFASCDRFVFPDSGYSRTAAMFSMRPASMHLTRTCDPEHPVEISTLAEKGSSI
ncbi:hypothetical protein CLOP_g15723 [Closterium sp. NIES-67]|nr:hypothetical protein CLOP_g15723 [Closterium sp. NIES-67]